MDSNEAEVTRRKEVALSAIKSAFDTDGAEYSVNLFVNHHVEEIGEEYWRSLLGKSKPEPEDVLGLLILQSHWSEVDEDGIDVFDFTLPNDITDSVLSVSFDEVGQVTSISMES